VSALRIVVYSDYLCPWCHNAAVRMHRIEDEYRGRVEVAWRSFLLRPHPDPQRTLERFRAYTRSWLRPAAEDDAGTFRVWATEAGPPSHSVPPHIAAKAAADLGAQHFARLHQKLLHAYFAENRDITDWTTLRAVWSEAGLASADFPPIDHAVLEQRVRAEHAEAIEAGVTGVPAVRLGDDDVVITGAYPLEFYRRWIDRRLT
jgi:predicted DsbA family dithiol-disulfide isomerase